ncbi:MAG TPA: hypothetical protein VMT97_19310 [Terriglobales bacterium]|nr:hypothetical protein [Terriglobales bacterium]
MCGFRRLLPGVLFLFVFWQAAAAAAPAGECSGPGGAGLSHCLYRSLLPSTGIAADCKSDSDCRIGYYYGQPDQATWFRPPPGMVTMPKPEVIWHSATFAEVRVGCGPSCTWSYFFEGKRRQLSEPRRDVLQVDYRRLLMAQGDGRALPIRHIFSARDVVTIERDWSPGMTASGAIKEIRFDPDGRLSFTWLKGDQRTLVTERVTIPSF